MDNPCGNNNCNKIKMIIGNLTIHGTMMITAGEYFEPRVGEEATLSLEELTRTVGQWNVHIMKSHGATASQFTGEDIGIDHIVGKINRVIADPTVNALKWEGIIADKDIARKIALGLIQFVSVTFKNTLAEVDGKFHYVDIMPIDLSLVFDPRDKNASVKAGGL